MKCAAPWMGHLDAFGLWEKGKKITKVMRKLTVKFAINSLWCLIIDELWTLGNRVLHNQQTCVEMWKLVWKCDKHNKLTTKQHKHKHSSNQL